MSRKGSSSKANTFDKLLGGVHLQLLAHQPEKRQRHTGEWLCLLSWLELCKLSCLVRFSTMPDQTQMDDQNKAMCYALRNPPEGKPLGLKTIKQLVKKKNGQRPSLQAISLAAKTFQEKKKKRGRKLGQKKTTTAEDAEIMTKFRKLRPPGHYVDAHLIHRSLPKKIKKQIGIKTVTRRVNAKGYFYQKKRSKDDPSEQVKKRRMNFCRSHEDKSPQQWKAHLQAVADLSEPPPNLKTRFRIFRLHTLVPFNPTSGHKGWRVYEPKGL